MTIEGIGLIILGYLAGSIPIGLLLSKAFSDVDPRKAGSRNIGATNILRTAGKKLGALTLAGDCLKGLIPVLLALWLMRADTWICLVALAAFAGHLFPIFLKFKGGKGVATALGVYLGIAPLAVLIDAGIFFGVLLKWRVVSLSSLTAAAVMPILIAILTESKPYVITSLIIAGLIYYRHHENIRRLLAGSENRLSI
ncbi:MAG: glycerol-3-phosphate acyltransferase [Syntrophobacterales bacterium]|nr:MAG: glycerol-3-phosphate acyltransferase [Syntrophobacterales bacterium]